MKLKIRFLIAGWIGKIQSLWMRIFWSEEKQKDHMVRQIESLIDMVDNLEHLIDEQEGIEIPQERLDILYHDCASVLHWLKRLFYWNSKRVA